MKPSLLLVTASLVAVPAAAQITLTHLATVDLDSTATPTNPEYIGSNPSNVAWNGIDLFVAGFNSGSAAANVGLVRVANALTAPAFGTAFGVVSAPPGGRGYTGIALAGNTVVAAFDPGAADPTGIAAYDLAGVPQWAKNGRGSGGVAFDPGFPGGNPALGQGVAWTTFNSGRRLLQDTATGADVWTTADGMIVFTTGVSTLWRDLDFDPTTGDVWLRAGNNVVHCVRTGDNAIGACTIPFDPPNNDGSVEQNVAFLATANGHAVLFNDRPSNTPGQNFFTSIRAMRTDGTPETIDFGAFNPVVSGGESGIYDFAYDAGTGTLALLDYANRKVYVFSVFVPPYYAYGTGCVGSSGQEGRLAFGGQGVPGQLLSVGLAGGPPSSLAAVLFGLGRANLPILNGCEFQLLMAIPGFEITPVALDANGDGGVSFTVPNLTRPFSVNAQGLIIDTVLGGPIPVQTTNGVTYALP